MKSILSLLLLLPTFLSVLAQVPRQGLMHNPADTVLFSPSVIKANNIFAVEFSYEEPTVKELEQGFNFRLGWILNRLEFDNAGKIARMVERPLINNSSYSKVEEICDYRYDGVQLVEVECAYMLNRNSRPNDSIVHHRTIQYREDGQIDYEIIVKSELYSYPSLDTFLREKADSIFYAYGTDNRLQQISSTNPTYFFSRGHLPILRWHDQNQRTLRREPQYLQPGGPLYPHQRKGAHPTV